MCSLRLTVWTVLPDLKLPPESSLLAMLCVLVPFQHLDNCIPSLVARSQPLGQNAVTVEGNYESTLYASAFYMYVQFAYVLFTLAVSALPFKTAALIQISLSLFLKPSLVSVPLNHGAQYMLLI